MKETTVAIVGAGPSGLVLGLSLAQYGVHSTIIEKEHEIGEDPRGVFLAAEAVRILCQLGLQDQLNYIGEEANLVRFHKTDFKHSPFFEIPTRCDWLEQVVPSGMFQIQPRLEAVLEETLLKSPYCTLLSGCTVTSREILENGVTVHYDENGEQRSLKSSWLVGADGKTGIVRKKFLEPTAGVQQVVGLYEYTGTWVAANLRITLPTPETHPGLPFWKLKLCSEEVYDLFWPDHWHFCNPPGKATACGRFGPRGERLWRHEFAEVDGWNGSKDADKLLWEHLTPMITRGADARGRPFDGGQVAFPRDCIEVLRCRPFTFTQKVVNKWFDDRTILIGDAAHVFPPFGGQGIACGVGDADALAWRLALLEKTACNRKIRDDVLGIWSAERRKAVDDSTRLTRMNGMMCNKPDTWTFYMLRQMVALVSWIPEAPTLRSQQLAGEKTKYQATRSNGLFLPSYGGGGRLAQVYVKSNSTGDLLLSDQLLRDRKGIMTIVVLGNAADIDAAGTSEVARKCLARVELLGEIISRESVVLINSCSGDERQERDSDAYRVCLREELRGKDIREGYSSASFQKRFPKGTRYAIVRPDLIIFAACKTMADLEICMWALKDKLEQSVFKDER